MKAILIGAGRGIRLMPTTADAPKCYAEVLGKRILDWILDAMREGGVDEFCFIGGYRIDAIQRDYPQFEFRLNDDWPNNNILASLMYAEDAMDEPFLVSYTDVLFTAPAVADVVASDADITLMVDTEWLPRYAHRSQHPPSDAEKVTAQGGVVTCVHRDIDPGEAYGEYAGVAKFSVDGAKLLREHYHRCRAEFAGKPYREAKVFEKAYLIHLYQDMIERGVPMAHVDTPGGYWEIDTQQDFELARAGWKGW